MNHAWGRLQRMNSEEKKGSIFIIEKKYNPWISECILCCALELGNHFRKLPESIFHVAFFAVTAAATTTDFNFPFSLTLSLTALYTYSFWDNTQKLTNCGHLLS